MKRRLITVISLITIAPSALADGGTIIARDRAGGLVITTFASALRTGVVDLSVMVQNREGLDPVLDATVELTLTAPDGREITAIATQAKAQNKILYAVPVTLDQPGRWILTMVVSRTGISVSTGARFDVAASGAVKYWKYLAIPPAFLVLFTLHQWLWRRQGRA